MTRKILFLFMLALASIPSNGQRFKLITLNKSGAFIIPPKTKFKNVESTYIKHQYYYVLFSGISKDYQLGVSNLKKSAHWSGNTNFFADGYSSQIYKVGKVRKIYTNAIGTRKFDSLYSDTLFKFGFIDKDTTTLLFQFDFRKILSGSTATIDSNFKKISTSILTQISRLEGDSPGKGWPNSISQSIAECVFELIPVAQYASLYRYAIDINGEKSFVLINPKIHLRIDQPTRMVNPNDSKQFNYAHNGSFELSFFRSSNGLLKQNPFFELETNRDRIIPDNALLPPPSPKIHLQASSADLQLSSLTNDKNYIGIYTDYLKRNNSLAGEGDANYKNADEQLFKGNSFFILADKPGTLITATSKILAKNQILRSTFSSNTLVVTSNQGSRTFITAMFPVYFNQQQRLVEVNTTLGIFISKNALPENIKLYRLFNGKLIRFCHPANETVLLPGDQLKL